MFMNDICTVEDVMKLLHIKRSLAYQIIRKLNKELDKDGYYIIRGRIPRKYIIKRFGLEEGK